MTTDGKVEGTKKGRALLHARRMEGRGEEIQMLVKAGSRKNKKKV